MEAKTGNATRRASEHLSTLGRIALCGLVLCSTSCRKQPKAPPASTPSPPDLSQCTRIEVRIEPSTFEALLDPYPDVRNVLSEEELRYVESLKTLVIDDPKYIQALAQDVASVPYRGPLRGSTGSKPVYHVSGWRNEECLTSFVVRGPGLQAEGQLFGKNYSVSATPQLVPFQRRLACAENLPWLAKHVLARHAEMYKTYPTASEWCDLVLAQGRNARQALVCPSAGDGRCHYAMNPYCEPNSPADTVLLFETKAGWNQHGGPELFTFDNHDPKGGCILLNDGTVSFVRTEEELHALRWQ